MLPPDKIQFKTLTDTIYLTDRPTSNKNYNKNIPQQKSGFKI